MYIDRTEQNATNNNLEEHHALFVQSADAKVSLNETLELHYEQQANQQSEN